VAPALAKPAASSASTLAMLRTIGLMSGTSTDGVDAVLARFALDAIDPTQAEPPLRWHVDAHVHRPFPEALRAELLALNTSGPNELHRAALAANALVEVYAQAVHDLLRRTGLRASDVAAVGAHGQTVRHQPGAVDGVGYTVQLMQGALLAERCGIDVICDFRSRDVAAGGQGAPLVPAFHAVGFARPGQTLAVLNVGGIANLTRLCPGAPLLGFDCGPGNVLMDLWAQRHTDQPCDLDGRWAAEGQIDETLLQVLMEEPFLDLPPPKSTGRDLFHAAWLDARLAEAARRGPPPSNGDVMTTLTAFTARSAALALSGWVGPVDACLVCGGGAANPTLMRHLAQALGPVPLRTTTEHGLPADQVEAAAFAWLAWMFLRRAPAGHPTVTGASGPRVLGALYPAC
jgi:anhydro-N-acetylmuramic acid kinase